MKICVLRLNVFINSIIIMMIATITSGCHHHHHSYHDGHHHDGHLINNLTGYSNNLSIFLPKHHKAFQTINYAWQPGGQRDDNEDDYYYIVVIVMMMLEIIFFSVRKNQSQT